MSIYLSLSYDPNPNYELYNKAATLAKTINHAFNATVQVYPPDKYHPEMYTIYFNWYGFDAEQYGVLRLLDEAGIHLEEHFDDVKMFHKDELDLLLTYMKIRGYDIQYVKFNERK